MFSSLPSLPTHVTAQSVPTSARCTADDSSALPLHRSRFSRPLIADSWSSIDQRSYPAGTLVLANELAPTEFRADTQANWVEFSGRNFAWSAETAARFLFQVARQDDHDTWLRAQGCADRFIDAIESNLDESASKRLELPRHLSPWYFRALAWHPRAGRWQATDRSVELRNLLLQRGAGQASLVLPSRFESPWAHANAMKVFERRTAGMDVLVIAAHVAPVRLAPGEAPLSIPLDSALLGDILSMAESFATDAGRKPELVLAAICSANGFTAVRSNQPGYLVALSELDHTASDVFGRTRFKWDHHSLGLTRGVMRDALDLITPQTLADRTALVQHALEARLTSQVARITVSEIAREYVLRRVHVKEIVERLELLGIYRLVRGHSGEIEVCRRENVEPIARSRFNLPLGVRKNLLLLIGLLALGLVALMRDRIIRGTKVTVWEFSLGLVFAFALYHLQSAFDRVMRADRKD